MSEYEDEYGPVIPWSGGECPVDPEDIVTVFFNNNEVSKGLTAGGWCWIGDGTHPYHIIAYRVKKKKVPKVETMVLYGELAAFYYFCDRIAPNDTHKITLTKIDGEWQTEAKLEKL